MDTRRFGRSGWRVGAVGLGCWAIGGPFSREGDGVRGPMGWGHVDDAESIRAIHRALDLGVTLFDTANNYGTGHSERVLGRALAGRNEDVVVATKFGSVFDEASQTHYDDRELAMTREAIGEACEASLRRLGRETIDLYLLHHGGTTCNARPRWSRFSRSSSPRGRSAPTGGARTIRSAHESSPRVPIARRSSSA